eukprot:SAG22_NODE_4789_length_1163_cov_1.741541_2_plen_90_part_00
MAPYPLIGWSLTNLWGRAATRCCGGWAASSNVAASADVARPVDQISHVWSRQPRQFQLLLSAQCREQYCGPVSAGNCAPAPPATGTCQH